MRKLLKKIKTYKIEVSIVVTGLIIAALAHGWNMFHFPYYENDEGVYMSQAWSLLTQGKLAPYTYWYDHAPAGWFFIALWEIVSGGFFRFGFSINSGRVFMMILHVASCLFLYLITKKLTNNKYASFLSIIIFSLTPLGIYFQRRVLLDNIMTFWMLLSLTYLLYYKNKLRNIIISALAFGIGILSKETLVFLTPAYLYLLYHESHKKHKTFALTMWIVIVGITLSLYVFYALLKGELFPYGTFLGGSHPHVSLIDALKFQAGRGGGSVFDLQHSSFWTNLRTWIHEDSLIIYGGIIATLGNAFIAVKKYPARVAALLSLLFWYFLVRGGLVIEFYVIPLIPILALNIAVFVWYCSQLIVLALPKPTKTIFASTVFSIMLILLSFRFLNESEHVRNNLNIYTSDQTTPQIAAVNWILAQNIPNAFYIIDNYGYIDLKVKEKDPTVKTEWYWKVDRDPDVKEKMLHDNPNNVYYIGLTPQMKNDVAYSGLGLTLAAWKQSKPVTDFTQDYWSVDFWGDTDVRRVLASSWLSYKKHFIVDNHVIDSEQQNITTSEGQSYTLLRAVWQNDRKTYDLVWNWTQANMQQKSGLFNWKVTDTNGQLVTVDNGTAPDADEDIVLSLLFAYRRWNDVKYLQQAQKIIPSIWDQEVVTIDGTPYLTAGNWANQKDSITVNPSYLSPASYRVFASVDLHHPWNKLADSSYAVLQKCTEAKLDKTKGVLPPEWCSINKATQQAEQPSDSQPKSSDYSYNAIRVPLRIALDYQWYHNDKAKKYLRSLSVLGDLWKKDKKLSTSYTHDGNVWESYESVTAYAGNLGYFVVIDPKQAQIIYKNKISSKFFEGKDVSYWEDPKNYYEQNISWFGTGIYGNALPNLWQNKKI